MENGIKYKEYNKDKGISEKAEDIKNSM